jgi:hypothetical protein
MDKRRYMKDLTMKDFSILGEKWPEGLKVFTDWINQYKIENNWMGLFNDSEGLSVATYEGVSVERKAPKYHDLPGAMQLGIFVEFMQDRGGCEYVCDLFTLDLYEELEELLPMLQEEAQSEQ